VHGIPWDTSDSISCTSDEIEILGRQRSGKESTPHVVLKMLRVESRKLLRPAKNVLERHENCLRGSMDVRVPSALLNCDHDPCQPIQLLVFGFGSEPARATRSQTRGQHSFAALQQSFDTNLVNRSETAE
jgi:hypothetical protein